MNLYIEVFAAIGSLGGMATQAPMQPSLGTLVVDFSGGVSASSVIPSGAGLVALHADAPCSYLFGNAGDDPEATTADMRLAANETRYFTLYDSMVKNASGLGGLVVSAISNPDA